MEFLLNQLQALPAYQQLLKDVQAGVRLPGLSLSRATRLPVLAALYHDLDQPLVLVTNRADHALALADELAFWLPQKARLVFSEPTPLFYEKAAWGNATRRERLQVLTVLAAYHLPFGEKPAAPPVIVTSARALMTRTLPRRDFLKASRQLKLDQTISPESLLAEWLRIGYQPSDTVLEPGQFSHRGGLLDIWPPSSAHPVRLDFFGDEIDTLRSFDPPTQRTIEKLQTVMITPAREYLATGDGETSEFDIPRLHPFASNLLDYLPSKSLVLVDDLGLLESLVSEIEEQAVKLRAESIAEGTLAADFPVPYVPWSDLAEELQSHACLELGRSTTLDSHSTDGRGDRGEGLAAQFGHLERFGGRLKPFIEFLAQTVAAGKTVVIVSRQSSRLEELWAERMIDAGRQAAVGSPPSVTFLEGSLSEGWTLGNSTLITDAEIFGWERPQPRQRPHPFAETPEAAYADLQPGDWVVHVDYGIGRYLGLVQRVLEGLEREFLAWNTRTATSCSCPSTRLTG